MYQTASPYISVDRVPVPMLHSTESAADEKLGRRGQVRIIVLLGKKCNILS